MPDSLPLLAPAFRAPLEHFIQRLQAESETKDELISVVLYGGLARGEFVPGHSDVNLLLVLRAATLKILDHVGAALDEARREVPINLLTLTSSELADSAEVFPVKFLDIKRRHRILWGKDVAAGLEVPRERLQRQCARELMNLQLRLRQAYLDRRHRPELLEGALRQGVSTLFVNLAVLVELKTGQVPDSPDATLQAAGRCGLDASLLGQLLRLKRSELKPAVPELKNLYGALMSQAGAAANQLAPLQ